MISERVPRWPTLICCWQSCGRPKGSRANGTSSKLGYSIAESRPDFVTGHPSLFNWFAKTRRRMPTARPPSRVAPNRSAANESGSALALPPFLVAASRSDPFHPGREQYWRAREPRLPIGDANQVKVKTPIATVTTAVTVKIDYKASFPAARPLGSMLGGSEPASLARHSFPKAAG
jgi:hypothetical protein